jgi:hypothetical protein
MERIKLAVIMPVGPDAKIRYVKDTIKSVLHYTTASRRVIVLDDSGKNFGKKLKQIFPDIIVLKTSKCRGRKAWLFFTLCMGFEFAYKNYFFDVLLKMDTDALMIGESPEDDAIRCFHRHPEFGSIGTYKKECGGERRFFFGNGRQLLLEISDEHLFEYPSHRPGVMLLRKVFRKSRKNGYKPGEHCQGGAHFISRECIAKLRENKLLSRREIWWSQQEDDVIFGLLMCSTGLKHGDLASGSRPMGVRWRGLPCSPRELLARGKKVVHSTRFYKNLSEDKIRSFFRKQRRNKMRCDGWQVE